jgi:hypothetical protein
MHVINSRKLFDVLVQFLQFAQCEVSPLLDIARYVPVKGEVALAWSPLRNKPDPVDRRDMESRVYNFILDLDL